MNEAGWEHVEDFSHEATGLVVRLTRLSGDGSKPPLFSFEVGRVSEHAPPSRLQRHAHLLTRRSRDGGPVVPREDYGAILAHLVGKAQDRALAGVTEWAGVNRPQ